MMLWLMNTYATALKNVFDYTILGPIFCDVILYHLNEEA